MLQPLLILCILIKKGTSFQHTETTHNLLPTGKAHLGYNCNLKSTLQYKQFNQLTVGGCNNITSSFEKNFTKGAQLIQKKQNQASKVLECSLRISLVTSYCSTNFITGSRSWDGKPAISDTNIRLSKSECTRATKDRRLRYQDLIFYGGLDFIELPLPPSGVTSGWKTLRGEQDPVSGTCKSANFVILNKSYSSHTLAMRYDLKIKYIDGIINLKRNVMKLENGLIIQDLQSGSTYDESYGNFHWEYSNTNTSEDAWVEISRGLSHIYKSYIKDTQPIGIMESENSSLAMTLETESSICIFHQCRTAFETSIDDVFLVIHNIGQNHWNLQPAGASEISMLTQIQANSISVFITQEMSLSNAFDRISMILCEKSRMIIQSSIKNSTKNFQGLLS